jgi:hypothetical protein
MAFLIVIRKNSYINKAMKFNDIMINERFDPTGENRKMRYMFTLDNSGGGAGIVKYPKLGNFPLYAFFLYSEFDKDIAEFIRKRGYWLHCLSGKDCLICVFENPGDWGEGWVRFWKKRLGSDYKKISSKWMKLKPLDRNLAYELADSLNVEKNALPCLVFVEDLDKNEVLYLPIITNKKDYPYYFQDIFTAVNDVTKGYVGLQLRTLRKKWRKIWIRWILPQKIKKLSESIQEWGSVIKKTENAFIDVLNPFIPSLQKLKVFKIDAISNKK